MSVELLSEDLTHFIILERSQNNMLSDGMEQTERRNFLRKLPHAHAPVCGAPPGSHLAVSGSVTRQLGLSLHLL